MEKTWYYAENGQERKGPVSEGELKQLLGAGQLPASTLVWCEGMAQWTPAQAVAELQASPPPVTEKNWFYSADGQERKGPVAESELKRMLAAGQLPNSALVWSEGLASWVPASSLAALQPAGVVAAAVTAPQPLPQGPCYSRTHNRDLMQAARAVLGGHWGVAVGVTLIYIGIGMILQMLSYIPLVGCLAGIGSLLIEGPLLLGLALIFLALSRAQPAEAGMVFNGFNRFGTALGAYLLMTIFVFLWLLLFIIPGIIASYRYAMTFFILADHPELGPLQAISRSKEMMRGNKGKLFCLTWRFFWWALLCLLTCCIGFIWLVPYIQTSLAKFYDDLKPVA
jgi:uncharacterized membrane protein